MSSPNPTEIELEATQAEKDRRSAQIAQEWLAVHYPDRYRTGSSSSSTAPYADEETRKLPEVYCIASDEFHDAEEGPNQSTGVVPQRNTWVDVHRIDYKSFSETLPQNAGQDGTQSQEIESVRSEDFYEAEPNHVAVQDEPFVSQSTSRIKKICLCFNRMWAKYKSRETQAAQAFASTHQVQDQSKINQ